MLRDIPLILPPDLASTLRAMFAAMPLGTSMPEPVPTRGVIKP